MLLCLSSRGFGWVLLVALGEVLVVAFASFEGLDAGGSDVGGVGCGCDGESLSLALSAQVGADAAGRQERRIGLLAQAGQLFVELGDLLVEPAVAAGQGAQGGVGRGDRRVGCGGGAHLCTGFDDVAASQAREPVLYGFWGRHRQGVDLVGGLSSGLRGGAAGCLEHPDSLYGPVGRVGNSFGLPCERGPGLGVDGVGFALAPAHLAVRAVHLHRLDA